MAQDYTAGKKIALKTILILAVVTVVEVIIALTGKGYIIEGFHLPLLLTGLAMICLSFYKAYLIVYEFMHMKHEVKGLRLSVLLPMLLLVWAVIAFMNEGGAWLSSRENIETKDKIEVEESLAPVSTPATSGQ